MPKAFSEEEKQRIRERLLKVGRECFTRYGLKKTTIEDVVHPVGIAKSSFYLFFESKEALYVELMMSELPAMVQRLVDVSFGATDDTREALILLLRAILHEIETNEFARIIFDDLDQLEQLSAAIDFDEVMKQWKTIFEPLFQAITEAQAQGKIIAGDPQEIVQMLGIIKVLPMYRDKINPQQYPRLVELMSQVIADGLTCRAGKGGKG